jgi:hypothetical protein
MKRLTALIAILLSLTLIFLVSCNEQDASEPAAAQSRGAFSDSFNEEEGSTTLAHATRSTVEPITDFPVPDVWNDSIRYENLDDVILLFESSPHFTIDSDIHSLFSELDIHHIEQYHLPNEASIPEGYELVHVLISPTHFTYYYSSTPHHYEDHDSHEDHADAHWPAETSLVYHIGHDTFAKDGVFHLNGEATDAAHLVMTHDIGDNNHVLFD